MICSIVERLDEWLFDSDINPINLFGGSGGDGEAMNSPHDLAEHRRQAIERIVEAIEFLELYRTAIERPTLATFVRLISGHGLHCDNEREAMAHGLQILMVHDCDTQFVDGQTTAGLFVNNISVIADAYLCLRLGSANRVAEARGNEISDVQRHLDEFASWPAETQSLVLRCVEMLQLPSAAAPETVC